ncbi:MAG: hypothetical protein ABIN69_10095 [Aestuariivirga sp.]
MSEDKLPMENLEEELAFLVEQYGLAEVIKSLGSHQIKKSNENVLTIVCNKGLHPLPSTILNGEIFVASEGNLDFSSIESTQKVFEEILARTADKVRSKNWDRVYIVPFGHVTLSMQIKLLCYRILGTDTIDWFYLNALGYFPLELRLRELITSK